MVKEIPVIDLSGLDDPHEQPKIMEALMTASSEVGFFNLKNHGIPEADIQRMFGKMEDFFALPDESKATITVDPDTYLGWEKNAEISPATG